MPAIWMPEELPACISYGIDCMPWWAVDLITLSDGTEEPNTTWSQSRHEYNLDFISKNPADYLTAKSHFMRARGKFKKWPLQDPTDYWCDEIDGVVMEDDDGNYRIYKRYGEDGADAYFRKITRPVNPVLYNNGVVETAVSIDPDTGIIEGVESAGLDVENLSWECALFWVPVRYDIDRYPSKVTSRSKDDGYIISVSGVSLVEVKEG